MTVAFIDKKVYRQVGRGKHYRESSEDTELRNRYTSAPFEWDEAETAIVLVGLAERAGEGRRKCIELACETRCEKRA